MKPNIAEIRESLDREDDDFQLSRKKLREYATELCGEVERQAEEIKELEKHQDEGWFYAGEETKKNEKLEAEIERLRKALKDTRTALRFIPSDTVGYNGVLSVINEALSHGGRNK